MDCALVGSLILKLRKEKGLTQKQLADLMNISDKAVSKWERGLGCPDVSLLVSLSDILGVNIDRILSGDISPNDINGGNMRKLKLYVCDLCKNVITSTAGGEMSCCGKKLEPLVATEPDEQHIPQVDIIENDYFVTFNHPMTKQHFISFFMYSVSDRMLMVKLYPEQNPEVRFPMMFSGATLYYYCSEHGLIKYPVKRIK